MFIMFPIPYNIYYFLFLINNVTTLSFQTVTLFFMQKILIVTITSINVFPYSANKITNIYETIKLFPCFF